MHRFADLSVLSSYSFSLLMIQTFLIHYFIYAKVPFMKLRNESFPKKKGKLGPYPVMFVERFIHNCKINQRWSIMETRVF